MSFISFKKYFWENPINLRYYAAFVQKDLFEDWIAIVWYGSKCTRRGRQRSFYCKDESNALKFLESVDKKRAKRGYFKKNFLLN